MICVVPICALPASEWLTPYANLANLCGESGCHILKFIIEVLYLGLTRFKICFKLYVCHLKRGVLIIEVECVIIVHLSDLREWIKCFYAFRCLSSMTCLYTLLFVNLFPSSLLGQFMYHFVSACFSSLSLFYLFKISHSWIIEIWCFLLDVVLSSNHAACWD